MSFLVFIWTNLLNAYRLWEASSIIYLKCLLIFFPNYIWMVWNVMVKVLGLLLENVHMLSKTHDFSLCFICAASLLTLCLNIPFKCWSLWGPPPVKRLIGQLLQAWEGTAHNVSASSYVGIIAPLHMLEAWLIHKDKDTQIKSLLAICLSLLGRMCRCRVLKDKLKFTNGSVAKALEFSRWYKIKNVSNQDTFFSQFQ